MVYKYKAKRATRLSIRLTTKPTEFAAQLIVATAGGDGCRVEQPSVPMPSVPMPAVPMHALSAAHITLRLLL